MIWKCKCGVTKTTQPYRSSVVKEMMCNVCAGEGRTNPKPIRSVRLKGWVRSTVIRTRVLKDNN